MFACLFVVLGLFVFFDQIKITLEFFSSVSRVLWTESQTWEKWQIQLHLIPDTSAHQPQMPQLSASRSRQASMSTTPPGLSTAPAPADPRDSVRAALSASLTQELSQISVNLAKKTGHIPDIPSNPGTVVDDKDPEWPFLHNLTMSNESAPPSVMKFIGSTILSS
eukprot:m.91306 g.91306  ORF g.91306 m.91306 type:complete len:165 (+) comp51138_c0_seq1:358-852(+)